MSDDIEKEKTKVELENLGRLVDRYAQSRSLGLLLPLAVAVINTLLILGTIELLLWKRVWWSFAVSVLVVVWVIPGSLWLCLKVWPKHEHCFYSKKEGKVQLHQKRIPVWAWVAFAIGFVGPAVLSKEGVMSVRWALTVALTSFGIFTFSASRKQKEKILGIVYGTLCLLGATAMAAGVPYPFKGSGWIHTYFTALMIYLVSAGLVTAVVAHIYNRKILRKIKEMRSFGEQKSNKSDS